MKPAICFASLAILLLSACSRELVKDEIAIDRYREANEAFSQERYQECIPHYEYVIRWRDRIFDAYLRLGTCYEKTDRFEDAVAILQDLVRVDPTNEPGMRALSHAYEKNGNLRSAMAIQQKILDRNPEDKEAWNELLRLRRESGE